MPVAYIPVLIFALIVLSFPVLALLLFKLIRPESRVGAAKFQPYECGIPPESNARGRYSARFYIVAMLFVIFDVETLFLFPWAILYRSWVAAHMGAFALISMFVFLGILLVGYVWLYKKGAFDWA
ncbi:MAG TPA: NADH-quinone oxidoreductase subunit A [Candidatus Sulfotelmatobacter sp.]|jgi:NADH-quinone oxidoreductase subunit A|nr:NADH-quinone oxidoreductase subunit A [Candidatus Sulfotelmatobacter sp.]